MNANVNEDFDCTYLEDLALNQRRLDGYKDKERISFACLQFLINHRVFIEIDFNFVSNGVEFQQFENTI